MDRETHASRWRLSRPPLVLPPKVLGKNEKRQSGGVYWHPCKASASPLSPERPRVSQDSHKSFIHRAFAPLNGVRYRTETPAMRIALYEPDIPQNTGTI